MEARRSPPAGGSLIAVSGFVLSFLHEVVHLCANSQNFLLGALLEAQRVRECRRGWKQNENKNQQKHTNERTNVRTNEPKEHRNRESKQSRANDEKRARKKNWLTEG